VRAKKLTGKEIEAARQAISHAEADSEGGGEWDKERCSELTLGVQVLRRLLNEKITKAEGRIE
jgi:hypothetical protein